MKNLKECACGETITVRKVRASREDAKRLEAMGVMPGSDIEVLAQLEDGALQLRTGCKTLTLTAQDAGQIAVEPHFTRKSTDPVFFSGCCAYGNSAGIWDKINQTGETEEK